MTINWINAWITLASSIAPRFYAPDRQALVKTPAVPKGPSKQKAGILGVNCAMEIPYQRISPKLNRIETTRHSISQISPPQNLTALFIKAATMGFAHGIFIKTKILLSSIYITADIEGRPGILEYSLPGLSSPLNIKPNVGRWY